MSAHDKRKAKCQPAAGRFFTSLIRDIREGDIWVKLSLLVCGTGYFARKQYVKGTIITLLQAALMIFIPTMLWPYMSKIGTLGTVQRELVYNPVTRKNETNDFDNSFKILLFGIIGFIVVITAVVLYIKNIRSVRRLQVRAENHKHIDTFREGCSQLFNKRFHFTLLSMPVLGVVVLVIVPLIVLFCVGFTNYDRNHLVPTHLFTWVGLENFQSLFSQQLTDTFSYSFRVVLTWTLTWAFFATVSTFFLGIFLAMFINNRKTYLKRMWRTFFVVAIAVPQFISLLLIRNFFADTGIVNTICRDVGITQFFKNIGWIAPGLDYIPFLSNPQWAKATIICINIWVGAPYIMLITTGILLNIPQELIESAQVDGANGFKIFTHIKMPYILFTTGPFLIMQFIGNLNNFNIIYLLTQEVYVTQNQALAASNAKEVDLLITWLYRLTQEHSNYKMASVIGILVFIMTAACALLAFNRIIRGNREENFQ